MAAIVFVHGIAQEQYSADLLESEWIPALAGGVRTAGFPDIADKIWRGGPGAIEARMAYYGRVFDRPGAQGIAPAPPAPEQAELEEQLSLEWLERAATRSSNAEQRQTADIERAHLRPDPAGRAQGFRSKARVVWKSLAGLRWFAQMGNALAQRFVERALSQVSRYLTEDELRAEVQEIVRGQIKDDTRVLIGHSLGSIVAYEVAHRLDRPLPLLVTLGSPLGLETIVLQRLRPPASFPPLVCRWVNVADTDDLVAAEPNLTNLFATSMPRDAIFEGSYTVKNGAEPHSAKFYLGKEHVGRPVGQVLFASERKL